MDKKYVYLARVSDDISDWIESIHETYKGADEARERLMGMSDYSSGGYLMWVEAIELEP